MPPSNADHASSFMCAAQGFGVQVEDFRADEDPAPTVVRFNASEAPFAGDRNGGDSRVDLGRGKQEHLRPRGGHGPLSR
jgi:hypothetical protein